MGKLWIGLLVLVGLVVIGAALSISFLFEDDDDLPDPNCRIPAGLTRQPDGVLWNPISEPGRCAERVSALVVDNGTPSTIQILLGNDIVDVPSMGHRVIVTPPGPFSLRARRDGKLILEQRLTLVERHTHVYNPGRAWGHVIKTHRYGSPLGAHRPGEGPRPPADRPLPREELFDAGEVAYVLVPPPGQITMEGSFEDRTSLQHLGLMESW
jgi:hypothetical protein